MTINPNYDAENHEENLRPNADTPARTDGSTAELHDFYYDSGFAAERAGELNLAVQLYKQAVHTQPDSALAWYSYGDALLALNRPEEAVTALRKAVELSPKTLLYHYDLGLALFNLDQNEEASREFAAVVATDPKLERASSGLQALAMTNLALSQEKLGLAAAGIATLTPALQGAVNILFNLGFLHFRAKQYAGALPFFEASFLLQPDNEEINHMLGITLSNVKRSQEGLKYLQTATKLDPSCSRAWYDLGLVLARLQQRKPARIHFRKVLRLEPGYAWPYYDLACLDALERKPAAAFHNLEQAVARGFNDIAYLRRDTDFQSLHRDARWKELLVKLGQSEKGTR